MRVKNVAPISWFTPLRSRAFRVFVSRGMVGRGGFREESLEGGSTPEMVVCGVGVGLVSRRVDSPKTGNATAQGSKFTSILWFSQKRQ